MSEIIDNKIKVSIVVPVFNTESFLEKCLDSIINQSLQDVEIILVDDGSTDGSADICKKYAAIDKRIVYYRKENEGLAAARQDGIDLSHGEYIGFVDSDDWLELNMYERMYSEAKKHNADIVFCNCFIDENIKNKVYLEPGVYDRIEIENKILPRTLAGLSEKGTNSVIRWCNWLRIYRRSLIIDNNISFGRGFRRSQDLQLTFETTLYAQKYVSLCDEYLYHNRWENNSETLSRGYTFNYWPLIRPLIDKLKDDVSNYKLQDFSEQMDLCTFFFAAEGIKNEYNSKKISIIDKIKNIDKIINDDVVQKALKSIPYQSLHRYFKMIYSCVEYKKGYKTYYLYSKYNFIINVYKPFVRKLINGKITGVFFKSKKD